MGHKTSRLELAALGLVAGLGASLALTANAQAQSCDSPNPADWPAPAKPYFMIAFDTSGSMADGNLGSNSCGYPSNKLGTGGVPCGTP